MLLFEIGCTLPVSTLTRERTFASLKILLKFYRRDINYSLFIYNKICLIFNNIFVIQLKLTF